MEQKLDNIEALKQILKTPLDSDEVLAERAERIEQFLTGIFEAGRMVWIQRGLCCITVTNC